jgi:hypothetical protein
MKSFSQFLQESHLNEEEARQGKLFTSKDKPQDFRNPKKIPFTGTDPTPTPASKKLSSGAPDAPKTSPGQLEIPEPKTTKVSRSQFRNAGEARQGSLFTKSGGAQNFTGGRTPFVGTEPVKATKRLPEAPPKAPKTSPGQMEIDFDAKKPPSKSPSAPNYRPGAGRSPKPYSGTPSSPSAKVEPVGTKYSQQTPSQPKTRGGALALRPQGSTNITTGGKPSSGGKPPTGSKIKVPSGVGKAFKVAGKIAGPASAALDVADERAKGSGWARSLAKGAVVAAGGALGGAAGSVAGPVGSVGGAVGGSMAASKAFDVAAGANAKERKAMATANRQRQSGSAVKGIGGPTSFDTKKNTMTTGTGAQRKTVGLAKTGVVQRGGQSTAGYLAYKGGKAVYKAGPSAQSLAKTSSNPLERIGRSLFSGAYKKSDAANAAKNLAKARQSDVARNKALGVKSKPAG